MVQLVEGRYTITNVRYSNVLILPDGDEDSDVVAGVESDEPGEKWNVSLLTNGKYTIQNHGFNTFANCGYAPANGGNVLGRERGQQWVIKETRIQGRYVISPSDKELFWSLADGESGTPLTLATTPTDTRNQWTFALAFA